MPANSAFRRWRQRDEKVKDTFDYIASSRPAQATTRPRLNKTNEQKSNTGLMDS